MKAIEKGQVVDSDVKHLLDEDDLPHTGRVTVSRDRFVRDRDALVARGDVGLRVASTQTADEVAQLLDAVETVALEFPTFTDGRAYSTARLLREKYGYSGELRAVGDVLRDQLFFMQRCGFDVLELREDQDPHGALAALREFSVTYQTAADGRPPVYRARE